MAERVERHRRDTIDRKEEIYRDLHNSYGLSLQAILQQPEPSHPEYLLRLYAASLQRDSDLLQTRFENEYALETARQLYHNEVDRIEDEYEAAKKAIKEKLLEACDERIKKLREEKDNPDLAALLQDGNGMYGDGHANKHATRRTRPAGGINGAAGQSGTATNGNTGAIRIPSLALLRDQLTCCSGIAISGVALPSQDGAIGAASMGYSASSNGQPNLSAASISDPFNYTLLPNSPALANNALHPSMLLLPPNSSALLQSLRTGVHYHSHRTTGGRTKAGYPPNGLVITPGTYSVLGKCITALNTLRAEEIADDMEGLRKKRKRGGEGRGAAARRQADPY